MTVAATIRALGGWATWRELRAHHSKRAILGARARGDVLVAARGHYVVGGLAAHRQLAVECHGVLSHLSAALEHGLKVKSVPTEAWISIPRDRGTRRSVPAGVHLHRADLPSGTHLVTSPLRTVIDCARTLPFDEALAVADSALRARKVTVGQLRHAAAAARGPGSVAVRRVAQHADGRAANPLESVLRALAIEEGFTPTPQLMIAESGLFAIVDLGDEQLRLVLEAEGYETHGTRAGLRRDCRRHTEFTVFGYDSMRYAYEDVMFEQAWTRWTLRAWRDRKAGRIPESAPATSSRAA
jgi:hypothetical protein